MILSLHEEKSYRSAQPAAGEAVRATLTLEDFRKDVLRGLSRSARTLPCKYLYDERGAALFEEICELEEYYPTRTEISILRQNIAQIAALAGRGSHLVDLGSGSGLKTRLLLKHLEDPVSCTPIDVAGPQLLESSERLAREFPGLSVTPVCADYTNGFQLRHLPADSERTLVFFPGSTIGNFEPGEAVGFLRKLTQVCGPRVGLLLGVDLKKDPAHLHAAYNDSAGITAQFNLNLLARANRELGADFELAQFRHRAIYNERAGRIEMHLVSRVPQRVAIGKEEFYFRRGECIVTEHSYKYELKQFQRLAAEAGFRVVRCWTDAAHWFSVHYLRADPRLPPGAAGLRRRQANGRGLRPK